MKRGDAEQARVAFSLLGVFVIAFALLFFAPWGEHGSLVVSDVAYVICASIATIFGVIATRKYGLRSPLGRTLLLLTVTTGLDAVAGIIWATYEIGLGILNPFPSIADAIWALFYVAAIAALWLALKKVWTQIPLVTKLTTVIIWMLLFLSVYSFAIAPQVNDTSISLVQKLAGLQYPVGDLILLLLCALLFTTLHRGVFGAGWFAFLVGLSLYSIADLAYSYGLWAETYKSGSLLDVLWFAGQLLWAYAFYLHLQFTKN